MPLGDGSNYSVACASVYSLGPFSSLSPGFDTLEAAEAMYPFILVEHIERWLRESEEHYHEDEAHDDDEDDDDMTVALACPGQCVTDNDAEDSPAQY